ncbi:DUF2946 domain-containing protein [Xenophilus arseniciresistens]|uniref:DUF2946 domain-containing protein n=1 Tax=Xenophilus arseniciresistens TaxID=1283306 RepID=A0AAE3NA42_9BURK|nr:DUF2946 family protein [Xenophilus arseniciresistens]MDA7417384.1 DUF2946 domain-containing protein [Xenophilus arseniciresistens]
MQLLRAWTLLARLVLAGFVLSLGVAAASPLVKPQALQLVCSTGSSGAKLVLLDDEPGKASTAAHHALDCPACVATALPSPPMALKLPAALPAPLAQHRFEEARLTALAGAALPPRGPPASA